MVIEALAIRLLSMRRSLPFIYGRPYAELVSIGIGELGPFTPGFDAQGDVQITRSSISQA